MLNISEFINITIANERFSLLAELFSFCTKLYLLIALILYGLRSESTRILTFLLIVFLSGALLNDISWILIFIRSIFYAGNESKIVTFIMRIGWALFLTKHQALSLFLTYLIEKKLSFKFYNIALSLINFCISFCFLYLAFFKFGIPSYSAETLQFECNLIKISHLIFPFMLFPAIYRTLNMARSGDLPKILTHQLKVFIKFLILPHFSLELIISRLSFLSFISYFIPGLIHNTLLSISTFLCSYALYYCSKSIMGLRFLNASGHVESPKKFNFITDFKDILEQLSYATGLKELAQLTKIFFKDAFEIPVNQTRLFIRKADDNLHNNFNNVHHDILAISNKVENFLINQNNDTSSADNLLNLTKIFIKDEIEFSNFYEKKSHRTEILAFLDSINADIFLPIYERQTVTAYILIERNARPKKLYDSTERDEMLVFTSYLSNIINLLKNSNFEALIKREKELREEVYLKHQEINQYKESLRSFLRIQNERKIGIVFYRSRKFTFANKAAQELIDVDLNLHSGHTLTKSFHDIVNQVQEYKSSITTFVKDTHGTKLILSAIPSLEQNHVIILIYYPEASDVIKSQLDLLKDPSKWDYLLYLETTESGKLINKLIPGNNETLFNFKIELLTAALSPKALLLQMPDDDLIPTVEILHHISLRQNLHIIKLSLQEKNNEIGIKLFGINPLIQSKTETEQPLLEKLNNVGTLFIQNLHLLNLETQNYLADFLTYGFFCKFKSDHKISSNVRIICSTTKNLQNLVTEGLFCKALFNELQKTSLTMPSIASLSDLEIMNLAQGFTEQAIKTQTFSNLLDLNEKDKAKILEQKAVSLKELKEKVHQLLLIKTTKNNVHDSTQFNSAYYIADPSIAQAVELGKDALKNQQMMTLLWDKYKNQNKIASLLRVNRSSVYRRCIEYNLIKH